MTSTVRWRSSSRSLKRDPSRRASVKAGARVPATITPIAWTSLAQAELFDQRAVALQVGALQIGQEASAPAHEHEQSAARVVVLALLAQVPGEVVDALGEQRDLDLRRAGVLLVRTEPRGYLPLALAGYRGHRRGEASRQPPTVHARARGPARAFAGRSGAAAGRARRRCQSAARHAVAQGSPGTARCRTGRPRSRAGRPRSARRGRSGRWDGRRCSRPPAARWPDTRTRRGRDMRTPPRESGWRWESRACARVRPPAPPRRRAETASPANGLPRPRPRPAAGRGCGWRRRSRRRPRAAG